MATENILYNTTSSLHNRYYPKQITKNFKLLNLCPALYILIKKALILNTCHTVKKFFA
jgi:hypothetical protein